MRYKRAILIAVSCLACLNAGRAEITITVEKPNQQKMYFGFDLERLYHWDPYSNKQEIAGFAVGYCPVDYIRVAIPCDGELEEGQFNPKAYDRILEMMRLFKEAKRDLKFFASTRPLKMAIKGAPWTCYPYWVVPMEGWGAKKLKPEKGASYLVNYLKFMKEQGYKISYMDIKNECKFIRPKPVAEMVEMIKEQIPPEDMPMIVAPSDWCLAGTVAWIEDAKKEGCTDFIDVVSAHNTGPGGTPEDVVKAARSIGKTLVANTELHGWGGPDERAVANSKFLWDYIRAGFNMLNEWLLVGNEKKSHKMIRCVDGETTPMRAFFIYRRLVVGGNHGYYVKSNIPDELRSTAAFIKDGKMSVWALNTNSIPVNNITVQIEGRTISGDRVKTHWWDPDSQREGEYGDITPMSDSSFTVDTIGPDSLHCFMFPVEDAVETEN